MPLSEIGEKEIAALESDRTKRIKSQFNKLEKDESIFSTECFLLIRILRPNDISAFAKKFTKKVYNFFP